MRTYKTISSFLSVSFAGLSLMVAIGACATSKTQDDETQETKEAKHADKAHSSAEKGAEETPVELIDREIFFGNADRKDVTISPDGKRIAYMAPKNGVMNIWVAPAAEPDDARAVTDVEDRNIAGYRWAYTNEDLLYRKDQKGAEQYHVYRTALDDGATKDLTPFEGVQARFVARSPKKPNEILVSLNKRTKRFFDVYRIDIETGDSERVRKNEGKFTKWFADDSLNVRLAARQRPDGGTLYLKPNGEGRWKEFASIPLADRRYTKVLGFNHADETVQMFDSRGRDTAALVSIPWSGGEKEVLFRSKHADVDNAVRHPKTHQIQAASAVYKRETWNVLDEEFQAAFRAAREVHEGDLDIESRSLEGNRWILSFEQDDGPIRYYLFDAAGGESEFLFVHRDELKGKPLAEKKPVVIESRDGLELVSYLTLPPWKTEDGRTTDEPMPLLIWVHGGPWIREQPGYDGWQQMYANRGYAVLAVNYRGSGGFGKEFLNAGNKEWGGKMHNDLLDARKWAIEEGLTTADQVGILGGSYGGYASLVGMTMSPDKFVAGVDVVGPSNLITFMENLPPYWKPKIEMFVNRIGDHRTEKGREFLRKRSPINYVDQIKHPMFIVHGGNDPRVKRGESDQIVGAMQKRDIPVTYAVFPDEGHGFGDAANRMAMFTSIELFLAKHLGGRAQPVGDVFENTSIRLPVGASHLKGVNDALCKPHPKRCEEPNTGSSQASAR